MALKRQNSGSGNIGSMKTAVGAGCCLRTSSSRELCQYCRRQSTKAERKAPEPQKATANHSRPQKTTVDISREKKKRATIPGSSVGRAQTIESQTQKSGDLLAKKSKKEK